MVESLLSPSNVLLYGRVLGDLELNFSPPPSSLDAAGEVSPSGSTPAGERLPTPPQPPRMGQTGLLRGSFLRLEQSLRGFMALASKASIST